MAKKEEKSAMILQSYEFRKEIKAEKRLSCKQRRVESRKSA